MARIQTLDRVLHLLHVAQERQRVARRLAWPHEEPVGAVTRVVFDFDLVEVLGVDLELDAFGRAGDGGKFGQCRRLHQLHIHRITRPAATPPTDRYQSQVVRALQHDFNSSLSLKLTDYLPFTSGSS